MKPVISIVLGLLSILFAYLIYQSITGPIRFQEVKEERYGQVINTLKDIKLAQEAHKSVTGKYAGTFKNLIDFVDRANYTITQQRDTSYMVYSEVFRIDVPKDSVIIDTLGTRSVKDSLFKKDARYKNMMNVPGVPGKTFEMKASIIDKGGYKAPVYEVKVAKSDILADQPKDLLSRENAQVSVEEVNGTHISVGSLDQVSTSGNWPALYDRKGDN
ncbi:hypothetical protein FEE95_14595 [Maribacter algarum]|uniref:Uncharacterized protein n=2 Tax=Maribacter algarum (ex Zhang et al. 2020) TaxID=2578118 RepID=A0A5S3QGB8_9FLAO|nr:hypothetical protein FEE95_14595 [Maribacter algarum]